MNLFQRIFRPAEQKASRGHAIHFGLPAARWPTAKTREFAREGYMLNVVGYSAINRLATAVASIRWTVKSGDKTLNDHPYLRLLQRPNPFQSGHDWWRQKVSFLLIHGNGYDEKIVNSRGLPQELWNLRPDRMKIVPAPNGMPVEYVYGVGSRKVSFAVDPNTGESEIRHTRLFNPLDDLYGMSPIQAAAYALDQHTEAMTWTQALLQNAARPSGALVVDKERGLSDDEFSRLKSEIEDQYTGADNAGRPMLLEGGLDWKSMGLSPEDMQARQTLDTAARHICLAFGVPPLLLNIPGDNTYANYREARLGFYEDTVLPFVQFEAAQMNAWLGPAFGVEIAPDLAAIEAIAEKRERMWGMVDSSLELTVNEARAAKGFAPLPDPVGSMLMADLKNGTQPQAQPDALTSDAMKEFAYGRSS